MTKSIPPYLKLLTQEATEPPPSVDDFDGLAPLCDAFREATGWTFRYVSGPEPSQDVDLMWSAPVNPGVGTAPGHFRIDLGALTRDADESQSGTPPTRIPAAAAEKLAGAFVEVWSDLLAARDALWRREAELAANVPVIPHSAEEEHLAAKLQSTLRAGAEAVHCHAAALYLLDDATSQLKLRSSWNLPFASLLRPARPLRGAMADLEALLGHAVVLEDSSLFDSWQVPDEMTAAAAVCVPVSTPTMPLGTMWIFSTEPRAFDDRETNMIEVVAGRLAAELERMMLLTEGVSAVQDRRQWDAVGRFQEEQLPSLPPLVEGWDVAGVSRQADMIGGAFHDWFMLGDGSLAMAVGRARQSGVDAALTAAALRSALRSHAAYHVDPQALVARVNETLWNASAGDQFAQLAYLVVDPRTGDVRLVSAGNIGGAVLRSGLWVPAVNMSPELGTDPDARFAEQRIMLAAGETLVITSGAVSGNDSTIVWPWNDARLSETLLAHANAPARQWTDLVRDSDWATGVLEQQEDLALLVVRRAGGLNH